MTLILGLNLSDRVYLVADSRLTKPGPGGEDVYSNEIIKLKPLLQMRDHTSNLGVEKNYICVAAAGTIRVAKFVFDSINEQIKKKELSFDIRKLYDQLNDDWVNDIGKSWHKEFNLFNKSCSLIFAGTYSPRPKRISIAKVNELQDIFHEKFEPNMETNEGPAQMSMIPSYFTEPLLNKNDVINELPDSLIFCIKIRITPLGAIIMKKEKAEYGSLIASGYGITKQNLPSELLARCELMPDRLDAYALTKVADFIRSKSSAIGPIGGPILGLVIKKDFLDSLYFSSETKVENNEVYFKQNDATWVKGIFFTDYEDNDFSSKI
jgi:hypothetical protein